MQHVQATGKQRNETRNLLRYFTNTLILFLLPLSTISTTIATASTISNTTTAACIY